MSKLSLLKVIAIYCNIYDIYVCNHKINYTFSFEHLLWDKGSDYAVFLSMVSTARNHTVCRRHIIGV